MTTLNRRQFLAGLGGGALFPQIGKAAMSLVQGLGNPTGRPPQKDRHILTIGFPAPVPGGPPHAKKRKETGRMRPISPGILFACFRP